MQARAVALKTRPEGMPTADNFQIIDEVSAEDTISMWVRDEMNIPLMTDGSLDTERKIKYKLK